MSNSDLPIDPNEPVYCYCQQVSFGEMVACDNEQVRKKEKIVYRNVYYNTYLYSVRLNGFI